MNNPWLANGGAAFYAPGVSTSGGASFPTTAGLVYSTSTTAARPATSSDLTGLLGYTPLNPANNLSDVSNAAAALSNLGGAPANPGAAFFSSTPNSGSGVIGFVANTTRSYTFVLPYIIIVSSISYVVTTADNTANLYNIGIYNSAGTLVAQIGATPGTTFAPSTGLKSLALQGAPVSLPAGTYLIAITSNGAGAALSGASGVLEYGELSSLSTTSAVFPPSITFTSPTVTSGTQLIFLLH